MDTFIFEDVYVVEAIGVAHIQCMCESCHYYALYGDKKCVRELDKREQYYESWNNNCNQCQMLLIAKTEQWKTLPNITHGNHIANVLAEKLGTRHTHLEGVNILQSGKPFDMDTILYRKGCIEEEIGEYSIGWLWRNIRIPDTVKIPKTLVTGNATDIIELMDECIIEKCDVKIQFINNVADVCFRKCEKISKEELVKILETTVEEDEK